MMRVKFVEISATPEGEGLEEPQFFIMRSDFDIDAYLGGRCAEEEFDSTLIANVTTREYALQIVQAMNAIADLVDRFGDPARAGVKGAPGESTPGELVRGTDSLPRPNLIG
jgi:hypothetical protein